MLRIIAGEEELDSGSIVRRRSLKISYLTQESHFPEEKSILEALVENFALRMGEQEREAFGKKVMQEIGLEDFYSPCKILSGGQKKQLALLAALNTEPDLLLLDEPTNHLDEEMAEWLEEKLKRFKGAILLVSHDRYFLDTVCDVSKRLRKEPDKVCFGRNWPGYEEGPRPEPPNKRDDCNAMKSFPKCMVQRRRKS